MNEEYLKSLDHDLVFRAGFVKEAIVKGVTFGSKEFLVYHQLRWYETDGKFKFCMAGTERLGEDVGMTSKEVENALTRLKDCGLVEHVWCDEKIYRNKTKIWISIVKLANCNTNVDAIKVLKRGAKNVAVLGKTTCPQVDSTSPQVDSTSPQVDSTSPQVGASPVITGVGNTKEILNKYSDSANASSQASVADATATRTPKEELDFPFDDNVLDVRANKNGQSPNAKADRRAFAIAGKVYKAMGLSAKPGVKMRNRIKDRLDEGYTEDDILNCLKMCEKDDFYGSQRDPMVWTSEGAMAKYKLNNDKPGLENRDKVTKEYEIKW